MNEDEPEVTDADETPEKAPADQTPTPEDPKPAASDSAPPVAPSGDTARLVLAGPVWCTAMNFPRGDGGTLVVTRAGLDVPADDAEDLIETASKYGVRLTRSTE